jgi:hypothetical protein
MPASSTDGDGRISTVAYRASNCSLTLRWNRVQWSAPGMIPFSCDTIWQPLHTPSVKVSGRAKNVANMSATFSARSEELPADTLSVCLFYRLSKARILGFPPDSKP